MPRGVFKVERLVAAHLAEESLLEDPSEPGRPAAPSRHCDRCRSKQHAIKSTVLRRYPAHLLVSLKVARTLSRYPPLGHVSQLTFYVLKRGSLQTPSHCCSLHPTTHYFLF